MNITELQAKVHQTAKDKGWWDDCRTTDVEYGGEEMHIRPKDIAAKLCLIHSEVSEALECVREGDMLMEFMKPDAPEARMMNTGHTDGCVTDARCGWKPVGLPSEFADIVIRVMDLAQALGIDLEHQVQVKMAYNEQRKYKHGGKTL